MRKRFRGVKPPNATTHVSSDFAEWIHHCLLYFRRLRFSKALSLHGSNLHTIESHSQKKRSKHDLDLMDLIDLPVLFMMPCLGYSHPSNRLRQDLVQKYYKPHFFRSISYETILSPLPETKHAIETECWKRVLRIYLLQIQVGEISFVHVLWLWPNVCYVQKLSIFNWWRTSWGSSSSPYCMTKSIWLRTLSRESDELKFNGMKETRGWSSIWRGRAQKAMGKQQNL